MNSLFQLEIPKRQSHCFHQGERLSPGMEIYSLLLEDPSQTVCRRDFCSLCWSSIQIEREFPNNRGYWKSKIESKKSIKSSNRIERALTLLREKLNAAENNEAELFVLCLFLSHARQLTLRQEFQKDGETYQLYEILRQEEFVTVKVLVLSEAQIEAIQKSLADQLSTIHG